ncbi:unnamed protein product [Caenorhabditis angaria]|uniref:Uncharacterized protein n=1 Tax=Caenorhabditis angaria TaxID=860376 RepID=A0A9P1I6E8_9PELO|nr:unnamed protein product [Caenorhabditis angaria]
MSAENILVKNAELQIQILDLEDELTQLKTQHVIRNDENQEIAAELAIMKQKYEDEKKEALEELEAKHLDEMIKLRKDLHEKAHEFMMTTTVKEMKKAGINQTLIYNKIVRKRYEFKEDLGSIFKINLKRPMKTQRQRINKNIAEKSRKYFEETRIERETERKRKHAELEDEDVLLKSVNQDERIKLQNFIEEQKDFEPENAKRARFDTDCDVEISIPRYGNDQAEYKNYRQSRVLDPNQGLDFFADSNVFIHKNMETSLAESDSEAEEEEQENN